jgi:hypothetical protein
MYGTIIHNNNGWKGRIFGWDNIECIQYALTVILSYQTSSSDQYCFQFGQLKMHDFYMGKITHFSA